MLPRCRCIWIAWCHCALQLQNPAARGHEGPWLFHLEISEQNEMQVGPEKNHASAFCASAFVLATGGHRQAGVQPRAAYSGMATPDAPHIGPGQRSGPLRGGLQRGLRPSLK